MDECVHTRMRGWMGIHGRNTCVRRMLGCNVYITTALQMYISMLCNVIIREQQVPLIDEGEGVGVKV